MKKKNIAAALAALLVLLAATWYALPAAWAPGLIALNRMAAGLAEHTVAAAGHQVHYLEGGQGETVVLLHGIFAEKDHWVDFARHLDGAYRVIAPDLPGFGESGRLDGASYGYAAQVQRLAGLLDALGVQRAHLAGNSMGGTIAVLFALQYPERVASVALIGAPHGIRSPRPSAMDTLIEAGQAPLVVRSPQQFEAMMAMLFGRRPFLPYPVLHATRADAIARADSNLRVWREQLGDRYLLDARIDALKVPALVLWGQAEQIFDPSAAETLRTRLPAAQVQLLPGVGHLPMMEAPRATAESYGRFLGGLAGAATPRRPQATTAAWQ